MIFLNTKLAVHIIYAFFPVSHSQHHSTKLHFNHSPDRNPRATQLCIKKKEVKIENGCVG